MTIVLTGGGTAGHVMPNISLLPYLKKYFDKICYIGGKNGMEKDIAARYGVPFFGTETVKLDRAKPLKNLKIPLVLPRAVKEAKKILSEIVPDIVYSKGGYAALPTVLAARSLGIPVVAHESDMTLGVANKLTARFCRRVFLSFENPDYQKDPKYLYAGSPVRDEIFGYKKAEVKKALGIPDDLPVVLFTGGSLGAQAINEAVYAALPALTKSYYVLHITGKSGILRDEVENNPTEKSAHDTAHNKPSAANRTETPTAKSAHDTVDKSKPFTANRTEPPTAKSDRYHAFAYHDKIGELFAASDLVVSRAGANTAAELYALGKRTLFIPLPKAASRGDQILNAEYYEKKNAARILCQDRLNEALLDSIRSLLSSPEPKPASKSPNAEIAKMIFEETK
ncbi:MAG: UDP-N-acetylglucosamine--N-acetylmuramyl-(pentapeptide) pyrophosphoryl-undecaprenol N-acetylglucosamine transferase [Clostridiales bacterium]|jgi:UDP-N-acetylglucosamine--N-acetylmuramyl-(pentapeptide) pyrophosphoryl-undecaprenol N-acetylglucosamine transferase|nr:UDP-N-acetylglucosamine--N-acetylmuramyl-(pentapeptide) pyrophosphoryl-undecaprenol N-acetylglucosamine transferase [Clostridiales bacterium]